MYSLTEESNMTIRQGLRTKTLTFDTNETSILDEGYEILMIYFI